MVNLEKILLVLGAGGHGKAVAEAALLSGNWERVVFADDRWPEVNDVFNCSVVSKVDGISTLVGKVHGAIVAVGNNSLREQWQKQILDVGLPLVSIIHPSAFVSKNADVGLGSAIMSQAMVGVDAKLGKGTIINANSTVDHDAVIGDFVHLGVGVQVAGGVKVGARSWLQAGCCAGHYVEIPEGLIALPGTALTADR